jgi:hypothetical protein
MVVIPVIEHHRLNMVETPVPKVVEEAPANAYGRRAL